MGQKKELYEVLRKFGILDEKADSRTKTKEKKSREKKELQGLLKSFGEKEVILSYNTILVILAVFLILLTLAFIWGLYSGEGSSKEEPVQLSRSLPADEREEGGETPARPETEATEVRYTVQAIVYDYNEKNLEKAQALAQYVQNRGLGKGILKKVEEKLVVCVGLFKTQEEAEELRDKIRELKDERSKRDIRPCKDAFVRQVRVPASAQ